MNLDCMVLGGAGMLGHKVVQQLRNSGDSFGCALHGGRNDHAHPPELFGDAVAVLDRFDVSDSDTALRRISELRPRVVVNCIGIVKQRGSAKEFVPSITVNALWPHLLAEAARDWGGRVIHFSTDCVFSGARGDYTEEDTPNADDLYGRTKLLGELNQENALTIRTSIIGRELHHFSSLLEWFIRQKGGSVRGFTRAWFSGVTTNYLARVVRNLIYEWPELSGLYHLAGPRISKHDLLHLVNDEFQLGIEIVPDESFFCDRSLNGRRFTKATGYTAPTWREMIAELASDPTPYVQWQD